MSKTFSTNWADAPLANSSNSPTDTDSLHLLKIKEDLETSRLNEANLRMEIEQMKLKYDAVPTGRMHHSQTAVTAQNTTPEFPSY